MKLACCPSDVHGPMIRRRSRPQAKNIHLQLRNLIGQIESAMIQCGIIAVTLSYKGGGGGGGFRA